MCPATHRAMVPLLAEGGVQFLHIGVNPASRPPDVPSVFRWRDPGGAEVIVMYSRGGYGVVTPVPGSSDLLWFAHSEDNTGPQTRESVLAVFARVRSLYPAANITASTLDAYAATLNPIRDSLPVIGGELGDTWIHGAGTDPIKVAGYRALLRLRRGWIAGKGMAADDPEIVRLERALLPIPEHTWGLDIKTYLGDWDHYRAGEFRAARAAPNYALVESSWQEQRAYLQQAVNALSNHALRQEAGAALAATAPVTVETGDFVELEGTQRRISAGGLELAWDERGALVLLLEGRTGRNWASPDHPFGLFTYEVFSAADYAAFARRYNINKRVTGAWAPPDFTKPGMPPDIRHASLYPRLRRLMHRAGAGIDRFVLFLEYPAEAVETFGAPLSITVQIGVPERERRLDVDVQWSGKAACRLPEALWFSFVPRTRRGGRWLLDKMGQWISPREVVRNGNRHLHAVQSGVRYSDSRGGLSIDTLDAPLVAPGQRSLLNFNNRQPAVGGGVHFALFNNIWGTNFPMWCSDDARFRFRLQLEDAGRS